MKRLIAALITIVILLSVFLTCTPLLKNRSQDAKYSDYFDVPERYDIVFLGSSHVIMGDLPMELWKDYGLSSYNLANYGQLIQADYWLLKLILSRCTPKLVVVDLYSTQYDDEFSSANSDYMHGLMDCFPLSKLRFDAIRDIFPEDMQKEYLFPLYYYHSRWDKIDKENFTDPKETFFYGRGSDESAFHGISVPVLVRPYTDKGTVDNTVEKTNTLGKDYLRKIIELCRESGVDVMCTVLPFLPYDDETKWINSAVEIAEEYGVSVCNGQNMNIIDPKTDMFDYGHLNSSGARKWTDVLGRFILENYDLPRYVNGEAFDFWSNEYMGRYIPFKAESISSQSMMYNYLMLCADKNLSVCLYIPSGSSVFSDSESFDLIRNMFPDAELSELNECDGTDNYFLCADKVSGNYNEYSGTHTDCTIFTSFGDVKFLGKTLSINEVQLADWNNNIPHGINKVQLGIAVIDNSSGSVLDSTWFYKAENGVYSNSK